ncbi:hypothetical protein GCM10023085_15610 [Actinomadura viridis]|uniref:Small metal-binding protein n=1 Tax=Actinomadura viridis TaxID=58110 RepID=A0A931DUQ0_9ACTN|nr:DUF1059 domain-containing protein [Actinomadura viridis]MBG6093930.1 putative small metal-binding protein [Actinomadura viridis]
MFIQTVEIRTPRLAEARALADEWSARTEGRRTALRTITAKDRDQDDTYVMFVEFPDAEAARVNSELPETGELAGKLTALSGTPLRYRDLDVVDEVDHRTPTRKTLDCRDIPSERGCGLTISGPAEEVLEAAAQHAVSAHGHTDDEELRASLRESLRDEPPGR